MSSNHSYRYQEARFSDHGGAFDPNTVNFDGPQTELLYQHATTGGYFPRHDNQGRQNQQMNLEGTHGGAFDPNAVDFETPDGVPVQRPSLPASTQRVYAPPQAYENQRRSMHNVPSVPRSLQTHSTEEPVVTSAVNVPLQHIETSSFTYNSSMPVAQPLSSSPHAYVSPGQYTGAEYRSPISSPDQQPHAARAPQSPFKEVRQSSHNFQCPARKPLPAKPVAQSSPPTGTQYPGNHHQSQTTSFNGHGYTPLRAQSSQTEEAIRKPITVPNLNTQYGAPYESPHIPPDPHASENVHQPLMSPSYPQSSIAAQSSYSPAVSQYQNSSTIYYMPEGSGSSPGASSYSYQNPGDQSNTHIREIYPATPATRGLSYYSSAANEQVTVGKKQQESFDDVHFDSMESGNPTHYKVRRTKLKGYLGNFFSRAASHQIIQRPHSYQKPSFEPSAKEEYRHQDSLQREYKGKLDDRFLNPLDGRVKELVVQCSDRVYRGPKNSTYKRTFIRNVAPLTLRVASWPMDHIEDHPEDKPGRWAKLLVGLKWPISCYILYHIIGLPGVATTGRVFNGGNYDPFPYRYWGYCKVTRNSIEDMTKGSSDLRTVSTAPSVDRNRILEPIYLMFVDDEAPSPSGGRSSSNNKYGIRTLLSDWKINPKNQHHHGKCPEYLFVAYTAEQFTNSNADRLALLELATKATRKAGLAAYWIGCSCMQAGDIEDDVYRISDIVRGAHSMCIVVGPDSRGPGSHASTTAMLQQWGERMWTLPEALLATPQKPITVYRRGSDEPALVIPKKQFAALAWTDSATTRQLIDHYEGNLTLTRLELVMIAMQTLFVRKTTEYAPGDHSYALMGLLRLRPKVDRTDSSFQAMARLSLANDSDHLLERLMCVLPLSPYQHWSDTSDAYGVNLWDINPGVQIAGICANDTILVDGAFGATIHWDRFQKVQNIRKGRSFKRIFSQMLLHGAPYAVAVAGFMYGWSKKIRSADATISGITHILSLLASTADLLLYCGCILFGFAAIVCILSPWLTRKLYKGKFWSTQAWLFGVEGYVDIATLESQIFGSRMHRLRWHPYGSPLSRHHQNEHNECVSHDPTLDPVVAQKVEDALNIEHPDSMRMRIFTLVDTHTMTVTLFEAARPPSVVLLCGVEGGMQRAIACSYEWTTETCYRETVLRFETIVLQRMSRVARVRFGMRRGELVELVEKRAKAKRPSKKEVEVVEKKTKKRLLKRQDISE